MSQAPAMPVFTDALIGDTTHLSTEEFGAYCLILFATWRNNGKPFPNDDKRLALVCRVSPARWLKQIRPAIEGFFDLSEGTWRQGRLEKEWLYVQDRANRSRLNGSTGGRPRKRNPEADPAGNPQKTQQVSPGGDPGPTQTESTHTQTHTQTQREDQNSDSGKAAAYAFEGRIIRLNAKDLDRWRKAYHAIPDLRAALAKLDDYYDRTLAPDERGNWFIRASAALDKQHQTALAAKRSKPARDGGFIPLGVGG